MGNTSGQNNRELLYYFLTKGMLKAEQCFKLICILGK